MKINDLKDLIARTVASKQGCKATELVSIPDIVMATTKDTDITNLIEQMVADGELVEVEYVLPNLQFRVKSFLLPAGTKLV